MLPQTNNRPTSGPTTDPTIDPTTTVPLLTVTEADLTAGLDILDSALANVLEA